MNEQNGSGLDVYQNLVTEDKNLGRDGLYHTKTDGVTLRDDYYRQELADYTPNNEKLEKLKSELAKTKEYLLGTPSKEGLIDLIKEIKEDLEARSQLLDPETLRQIDPEFKKLENELVSLEAERDALIARMDSVQSNIEFIEEANQRHAADNKNITIDFHDDEIAKLKAIIAEKEKIQREIEMLEKAAYDTLREDFFGEYGEYENSSINTKLKNQLADKEKELEILEKQERELKMKLRRVGLNAFEILSETKKTEEPIQEVETVTVSFDLAGGNNDAYDYSPITFTKGDPCMRPDMDPQLDDEHVFDCWTLNGEPFDFTQQVNENITLTAKYKELHKVTYFDKKGNELETITVPHGEKIENIKTLPDKKFTLFDGWKMSDGEMFDPEMEITEDIDLTAAYKKDWKKVAAIGAGVALGVTAKVADDALNIAAGAGITDVPGVITGATFITSAVGAGIAQHKLKNHKAIEAIPENVKGIKKLKPQIFNHFRKNAVYYRDFLATLAATSGIMAIADWAENKFSLTGSTIPTVGPTVAPSIDPTVGPSMDSTLGGNYDPSSISGVHNTAAEAVKGVGAETPIREFFDKGFPTEAIDTTTGIRIPVTPDMTADQICAGLGTGDLENIALNVTTKGESVAWVKAPDVFKQLIDATAGRGI